MKERKLGSGLQLKVVLKQESIKQTGIKKRAGCTVKKMSEFYYNNSFYCLHVMSNIAQSCYHHHHLYEANLFLTYKLCLQGWEKYTKI